MSTKIEQEILNKSFKKAWSILYSSPQQEAVPNIFESEIMKLSFIQVYEYLYTKGSGNEEFMRHWFNTTNKSFNSTPAALCQTKNGLLEVKKQLSPK